MVVYKMNEPHYPEVPIQNSVNVALNTVEVDSIDNRISPKIKPYSENNIVIRSRNSFSALGISPEKHTYRNHAGAFLNDNDEHSTFATKHKHNRKGYVDDQISARGTPTVLRFHNRNAGEDNDRRVKMIPARSGIFTARPGIIPASNSAFSTINARSSPDAVERGALDRSNILSSRANKGFLHSDFSKKCDEYDKEDFSGESLSEAGESSDTIRSASHVGISPDEVETHQPFTSDSLMSNHDQSKDGANAIIVNLFENPEKRMTNVQRIAIIIYTAYESYRTIISSYLIVFVPQNCGGYSCTIMQNVTPTNNYEIVAITFNTLMAFYFCVMFYLERERENAINMYLVSDNKSPTDKEYLMRTIDAMEPGPKRKIMRLNNWYRFLVQNILLCFFANMGVSCVVIYNNYLNNTTFTVFITNALFMINRIYKALKITSSGEYNIYSAYRTEQMLYNRDRSSWLQHETAELEHRSGIGRWI
jgi:hypothetical protein